MEYDQEREDCFYRKMEEGCGAVLIALFVSPLPSRRSTIRLCDLILISPARHKVNFRGHSHGEQFAGKVLAQLRERVLETCYKSSGMEIIIFKPFSRLHIHASAKTHEKTFSSSLRSTFANKALSPRVTGTLRYANIYRGLVARRAHRYSSGVGSMPALG